MAFYLGSLFAWFCGLDAVGIYGTLRQKFYGIFFERGADGLFEDLYKRVANDLAFLFRIAHACQAAKEELLRVDDVKIFERLFPKRGGDLFAFAFTQKASVHKDRVEA